MKKTMIVALLCSMPMLSQGAGLVNEMQTCQGLMDFLDKKLDSAPSKYDSDDVEKIRKGLKSYHQYAQKKVITPELLKAAGGDQSGADKFQDQVNDYRELLVKQYSQRYPGNELKTDHAIAINNCTKKLMPTGAALDELKTSLQLMIKLARTK